MKYIKPYKIFEARFSEFREIISTLKDICQEFEDNNCKCEIEPSDDIQLNIISLKSRGHLGSLKMNFYLDIDIDRRVQFDEKRSGMGPFAEWFIDNCKRIEEFMLSEGFKTLPSIKYPTDWENFDSIDELEYSMGLIQKVRLKFVPTAKPLDEALEYNADWKKHDSSIRKELELDLNDILLEINDLGFKSHISGWTQGNEHPYVWIRRTKDSPVPMKDHTHETVERIKDYLSQKGYQTKVDIINVDRPAMQIYIYFDKELKDDSNKYIDIEHLRESNNLDYNLIQDIKDILLPFSDMNMKVTCDYIGNGEEIAFNLMGQKEKAFDINDYKDDIDSLLSYMKEKNWAISKLNLGIIGKNLVPKNQNILSYPNGKLNYDTVKNPVFWITGEFIKIVYAKIKQVKESVEDNSDEVRRDIEEICYELTDYDKFSVYIRYSTSYSSRTGKDESKWVIFISLKNHLDYDGFLLSEVEDVIMRIKSYLGERRYAGCEVIKVGEPHKSAMRYVTDEDRLTSIFIYYTL